VEVLPGRGEGGGGGVEGGGAKGGGGEGRQLNCIDIDLYCLACTDCM
jgi:hypothetical protein